MFNPFDNSENSNLKAIVAMLLAAAIFGVYRSFCRAYNAILGKFKVHFKSVHDRDVRNSQSVRNLELPELSNGNTAEESLHGEPLAEQQEEKKEVCAAVRSGTETES